MDISDKTDIWGRRDKADTGGRCPQCPICHSLASMPSMSDMRDSMLLTVSGYSSEPRRMSSASLWPAMADLSITVKMTDSVKVRLMSTMSPMSDLGQGGLLAPLPGLSVLGCFGRFARVAKFDQSGPYGRNACRIPNVR